MTVITVWGFLVGTSWVTTLLISSLQIIAKVIVSLLFLLLPTSSSSCLFHFSSYLTSIFLSCTLDFGRKFGVHTARSVLTVNAGSFESATKLLNLARSRSVNWTTATATNRPEFLPNRAHHCVRVALHNVRVGWVSNLHFLDLVGHGRTPSHAPPFDHGDLERERRV